jgi:hypothetical protein
MQRFHDDETTPLSNEMVDEDEKLVEEIVMEGNPKAPRFHIEKQPEPPREAYIQVVSIYVYMY